VNEFVKECRSEWKRLGVPDAVANEMAADLAVDLEEAEADGTSAEEVLGSGAFDPRSFATAWAAERGVIQRPVPSGRGLTRGFRLAAAIGTLALAISIVGAVLVIGDSRSDQKRIPVAAPGDLPPNTALVSPFDVPRPARPPGPLTLTADGRLILLHLPASPAAAGADDSGVDSRTIGSVFLSVGLAGVAASTLFVLWLGPVVDAPP